MLFREGGEQRREGTLPPVLARLRGSRSRGASGVRSEEFIRGSREAPSVRAAPGHVFSRAVAGSVPGDLGHLEAIASGFTLENLDLIEPAHSLDRGSGKGPIQGRLPEASTPVPVRKCGVSIAALTLVSRMRPGPRTEDRTALEGAQVLARKPPSSLRPEMGPPQLTEAFVASSPVQITHLRPHTKPNCQFAFYFLHLK